MLHRRSVKHAHATDQAIDLPAKAPEVQTSGTLNNPITEKKKKRLHWSRFEVYSHTPTASAHYFPQENM